MDIKILTASVESARIVVVYARAQWFAAGKEKRSVDNANQLYRLAFFDLELQSNRLEKAINLKRKQRNE